MKSNETNMNNQDQARQVIHLHFVLSDEDYYFGSLQALYEHFTREQLGIALQTLYNQWKDESFRNELIVLKRGRLIQKKNKNS